MADEKKVIITIFGGSGDLAQRMLYPALFRLFLRGNLKNNFAVIGTARRPWTDDYYRGIITDSVKSIESTDNQKTEFSSHFYYQSHDVTDAQHYITLKNLASSLDDKYQADGNRVFYMAMAPRFFSVIADHLRTEQVLSDTGYNRLVIEKPFGHDYASAKSLNDDITHTFNEDQIYRIDHYLGKEMIQSLAAMRFTNPIFENVWNRNFIDNIQVTLAEEVGVEERAGYYETSGALRDMVQNHIMQVISLLMMEQPVSYTAKDIALEKARFFNSLHIDSVEEAGKTFVRGQYGPGEIDGQPVKGYRQEANVDPNSTTETFVAGKVAIDNERWCGVPVFLRTGKRMAQKNTQIDIIFKKNPLNIFSDPISDNSQLVSDVLTVKVEPEEGYTLTINNKSIGQKLGTTPIGLSFRHDQQELNEIPTAYERLILDVLDGDQSNFTHWNELAQSWRLIDNVEQAWRETEPDFPNYEPGSMGPKSSDDLLNDCGRSWFYKE